MIIYFEKFSILRFLFVLPLIRKCRKIYVFEPGPPDANRVNIDRIRRKVRFFIKNAEVEKTFHSDFPELAWECNEKALGLLEKSSKQIEKSPVARFLKKFCDSDKIILAVKKSMVPYFCDRVYYLHWARELGRAEKDRVSLVFRDNDPFDINRQLFATDSYLAAPLSIKFFNAIEKQVLRIAYSIGLIFMMIRKLFANGIAWRRPVPKEYDYGLPLAWGILEGESRSSGGLYRTLDDRFLNDSANFKADRFLYIYSDWKFSEEARERANAWIKNNGSDYADEANLKYYIKPYTAHLLSVLKHFFLKNIFDFRQDPLWIITAYRIINAYCLYDNFCQYYRVKVFFDRTDYSLRSIVRTIVQNKYSLKNAGLQHAAYGGIGLDPHLAYIYFDCYFARDKISRELFSPHWERYNEIRETGLYTADFVNEALRNRDRREAFRKKYEDKIVLLIALYNINSKRNGRSRVYGSNFFEELFQNIEKVLDIHPNLHIVLKPRRMEDLSSAADVIKKHDRIAVEDQFTTYELVAYSDITTAMAQSSVVLEALTNEKKAFAYNSFYIQLLPLARYDRRLVINRFPEFVQNIRDLINGDWQIGEDTYEKINRDFNSLASGHALERIKQSMKELV